MSILNILCIGDIVGRPGRDALNHSLSSLQEEHDVHFTIVNIENAAAGFGVTDSIYNETLSLNVDALTSGNHIYAQKTFVKDFDHYTSLVRPLNFPSKQPGEGWRLFTCGEHRIAVVNLIGRVFMNHSDCPFQKIADLLPKIQEDSDIIIVDFHAEATSEKQAMGWVLDGKVSAVFGTHTHIQTSDERILPKGTGYITDLGMVGAMDSILGMEKEPIINKFFHQNPTKFRPPETHQMILGACVFSIDLSSGKCVSCQRLKKEIVLKGF